MRYFALVVPVLFITLFLYALIKKVKLYDSFTEGVKGAAPLVLSLFPYLCAILILSELFDRSGLAAYFTKVIAPVCKGLGIPPELSRLMLLKPFSGSGSTALLSEILNTHGADSYIGRCACVLYGSSETVFYILAVYFAGIKRKGLWKPVLIALAANFVGTVVGCLICRVL